MEIYACAECGRIHLEGADRCGHCGGETKRREVSGRGQIYSFSSVHIGPKGMPTPYRIALVELEEGARVLARLADDGEEPSIGDTLIFSGLSNVGPVFRKP